MKEILYLEIPTPDTGAVRAWLQEGFEPGWGEKAIGPDGFRLRFPHTTNRVTNIPETPELLAFVWSVQRTTYLKVFRTADKPVPREREILQNLTGELRTKFPHQYPKPPAIDLSEQTIFEALAPYYPQTVRYFQKMPNGESDLKRVYWWEQRWREGVRNPQQPKQVVFSQTKSRGAEGQRSRGAEGQRSRGAEEQRSRGAEEQRSRGAEGQRSRGAEEQRSRGAEEQRGRGAEEQRSRGAEENALLQPDYDLIYVGGALGVIHAAVMAQLGYRVLLVERLPFGRMNREWNISRNEFQSLIDLGLFTQTEFESIIAREYADGFSKFFDANNPPHLKASVLHTPTVLNVGLDAEKLLRVCGEKLRAAGGEIWDETDFIRADVGDEQVDVQAKHQPTGAYKQARGRLLVDAMGTASPIAWQLNKGRAFDSVCPTVGAVLSGFEPGVWDSQYGDVLYSHGDISRGRQLIWELFPAQGDDITIYLFHYHEVNSENPGSLLEMYEDFFTILPEYRRCDMDKLVWKKPTFGYIPGHFSVGSSDRTVAIDRLIAIGDAASLQSPLVFTGFGSLVRNLGRLTHLLDTALKHDLLSAKHLNQISAYQSNISVTWLFSKGMMVPTGRYFPPQRINAMLNTFFGILASEPPNVAETFIKDRIDWLTFNRLALKAARINPALLVWIWELAGARDMLRWLGSYLDFTISTLIGWLLGDWFTSWLARQQPWLEPRYPKLWLFLLAQSYAYRPGMRRPKWPNFHISGYQSSRRGEELKV